MEHRIARRTTEIDISLNMLDRGQRAAAKLYQQLTSHNTVDGEYQPEGEKSIWVPVARMSRQTSAPIDVRDAAGQKIPRLTQYETSRLMASGLYRLLRDSLRSNPNAANPDTDLHRILFKIHEPRWLIEAALLTLFTERNRPDSHTILGQTPATVDGHIRQYRQLALNLFDEYGAYLKDYLALLDIALNEQLLVVALDATRDEHLLSYDSPLYVNEKSTVIKRLWRALRASGEGYYLQYRSTIPSTLRSYHLVFETNTNVDISQIYLSTDADARIVSSLSEDLVVLAQRLDSQKQTPIGDAAQKALELATQTALGRLSEVVRRRQWEASHVGIVLHEPHLRACFQLRQASIAGEATPGPGDAINNSILNHPNITSVNLRAASKELIQREMYEDLSLERDPVSNRAHAYWRRAPERSPGGGQIRIRAGALLKDATGSGPRDALLYALVLAAISYIVAAFLARSFWPYSGTVSERLGLISSREAVVAVLLLVPGFLYTRLTIPDPHSISGHLRAIPRLVERLGIFAMVLVAAAVAADSGVLITRIAFLIGTGLPLVSTLLLFTRQPYSLGRALSRMGAPKWTGHDKIGKAMIAPDVIFSSAGESGKPSRVRQ